ncbi:uncharacterized protein LOC142345321 isoform X2 [Convolutriloba macropyga]|uniref:uncharacterized protein LOC142345321 isoform X2 n=1 Tax=Convolutriloba macropyga TaxID=536237 RepID=UPI003F51B9BC
MTRERSRGRKRGTEKCNVSARKSKSQDVPINYEGVRGSGVKQGREGGAVGRRGSREEGGVELVATNKSHSLTPNRTVRFNRTKISDSSSVFQSLAPLPNIAADAVTNSSAPLVQSLKATLDPLRSSVPQGLPRNRNFAAKLPKIEKLRRKQEAICALHFSLHAGIKEIYDEMRQADQEEDESCHDYEVHGDDLK